VQLIGVIGYIIGGEFLVFLQNTVNGEFRANDLTQIAVDALPELGNHWRMVPFFIKFRGLLKDLIGAEFNTKITPFTAVFYNVQFPDWYRMGTGIQRQSPKFHNSFPSGKAD
jgi:hypothetical protein